MRHGKRGWVAWVVALGAAVPAAAAAPAPTAEQMAGSMHAVVPPVAAKDGAWALEFRFHDLQAVTVEPPGGPKKTFWVLKYQVVNRTGAPRTFVPSFELDAGGRAVRDEVYSKHFAERNSITVVAEPIPTAKPSEPAKGVEAVAVWECADPDAKAVTVFVQGLSSEFTVTRGATVERRTLRLEFRRDGGPLRFAKPAAWETRASTVERPRGKDTAAGERRAAEVRRTLQMIAEAESMIQVVRQQDDAARRDLQAILNEPGLGADQLAQIMAKVNAVTADNNQRLTRQQEQEQAYRLKLEHQLREMRRAEKE